MKRERRFAAKTAAAALAASMVLSGTAAAAPIDELNEIMEGQMQEEASLLEETLGMTEFGEAQKENGIQVKVNMGLSEETISALALEEILPEGGNLGINFEIDRVAKNWLLELGAGLSEASSLIDFGLYGDAEELALTIPQFFTGAVSLHAGNFREQYEASQWKEIMGEVPEDIPDINMEFYPEGKAAEETTLEDSILKIADGVEVEKTEDGDTTIYREFIKTEDIVGIYQTVIDEFLSSGLMQSGVITVDEREEYESDLEQMYAEMEDMLGEEVEVLFYVKDNMVEKITYSLDIDTTDYVVEDESEAEGGEENDTIMQADESFEGTVDYEIVFTDPANALKGMDINMTMTSTESGEYARMSVAYRVETEGTVEKTTASVSLSEEGGEVYAGTPFEMTFDAESGDLDVLVQSDDQALMVLDSTFTEIEKGKSFLLNVDELSFSDGTDTFGISGAFSLSAEPEKIEKPEDDQELLAMTQEQIMTFVLEIQSKATAWAAQFVPEETEITTEVEEVLEEETEIDLE